MFYVPETRGVGMGRDMDAVFGIKGNEANVEEIEDIDEITEETTLLSGRERRGSLGAYT